MSGPQESWTRRQDLPNEPLTPIQIETRLRQAITMLTGAQQALQRARDAETDAEVAYRRALYRATLSSEAPKVGRGSADATVGERDAWVQERTLEEWEAHRRAVVVREAAQDHLRTVRDITSVLQSLGASVRMAYEMAGRG